MSAHDIVVARVRDAIAALVGNPAVPPNDFKIISFGSDRCGETHYVVRRGDELVRVSVAIQERDP